ncbi:MAG: hypothetical protein O7G31_01185 [Calditrichaeota bacterium]|nr:hypothetical protein [Calditrichota bacterium]
MKYLTNDPILETDLVLIYVDDNPAFYGRVEAITADVKKKWWQVKFLFLTMPAQVTTWTIDDNQIRGADFTMGGTPIRIEKVVVPEEPEVSEQPEEAGGSQKKARVLSLDRSGKKNS